MELHLQFWYESMVLATAVAYSLEKVDILWRVQGCWEALCMRPWLDWKKYSSWREFDSDSSSWVSLLPILFTVITAIIQYIKF